MALSTWVASWLPFLDATRDVEKLWHIKVWSQDLAFVTSRRISTTSTFGDRKITIGRQALFYIDNLFLPCLHTLLPNNLPRFSAARRSFLEPKDIRSQRITMMPLFTAGSLDDGLKRLNERRQGLAGRQ